MNLKRVTRRSWSLAARLTTSYTVASFLFALFVVGILYWGLAATGAAHRALTNKDDRILSDKVHALRAALRDGPERFATPTPEAALEVSPRGDQTPVYVRLLDGHGRPRLSTKGMEALLPPAVFTQVVPADVEPTHGTDSGTPPARSFRKVAALARVGRLGQETWEIQVAVDRGRHEVLLSKYRFALVMMLAATVAACPLVAYRIARRGLRPLHDISETARHIGSATLAARIDSAGYPVELGTLADTFNDMLDRLDDSFRRLSQFSADIAHELRTPIHNMRGEAEVALSRRRSAEEYKEALTSCLEESVRLSEVIGSLLFLARAENPGTRLEREEVRVARELAGVRDYYAASAAEAGVTLSVAAGDEVVIALDRGLFQRAIANLVTNSLTHTPSGGTITLAAERDVCGVRIEVSDTGTGIPSEDLPRVFDRFYRADRSRSSQFGSLGLGLAIVKGIVTFHGGRTEIQSEMGKGTRVALIIPDGIQASGRSSRADAP